MSYAEVTAASMRSSASPDEKQRSQHRLVEKHKPDLVQDIWAVNATDVPGVARANVVATAAMPNGTTEGGWADKYKHMTPMQQHCVYWDADGDGVIWPQDTYAGVRAWGWSIVLSLLATLIIHAGLSYPTQRSWLLPDPLFRIYIARVHRAKHGSDSLTYDNQGRFRPLAFEEFFANYDKGDKGGLSLWDLVSAGVGQRNVFDAFGISAFALEWTATYLLLWPADGVVRKEDVRRVYDGSIFQKKADDYAARLNRGGAS